MKKSSKTIRTVCSQALMLTFAAMGAQSALACDGDYGDYIGSVCITSANFCPRNYQEAKGQILQINGNQALFSVIGAFYGGDGRTTFALPDLQGRTPVALNPSAQQGLSVVTLGQKRGSASNALTQANLPAHTHAVVYSPAAVNNSVTVDIPVSANNATTVVTPTATVNRLAASPTSSQTEGTIWSSTMTQVATVGGTSINTSGNTANVSVSASGGGTAYSNLAPEIGLRYCIATIGTYPPRN